MFERVPIAATLILITTIASAHHSNSAFDLDRMIAFQGTVVRYQWRNPHVYLVIKDADDIEWTIETGATSIMSRSGWTRDSFAEGDSVSLRANPDKKSSKRHALLLSIEGPGGVPMASMNRTGRSNVSNETVIATSLAGIWTTDRTYALPFMRSLREHPLTKKGQAARAQFDEGMNPTIDCIPWPTPFIMASNGLYLNEVELRDDVIFIRSEFYNAQRTVYLDGRGHPEDGERTIQGHSIGWWENDTLVVDTTLFADHRQPTPNTGIPSGAEKHVVERLTLSEDGSQVLIEILVNDPEYLAAPVTAEFAWAYAPHLEMLAVDCDPDVARRFLQ